MSCGDSDLGTSGDQGKLAPSLLAPVTSLGRERPSASVPGRWHARTARFRPPRV